MGRELNRQSTGVVGLDEQLGGGLIPGTLTVVFGATGIGKTQLGIQYARAGLSDEQRSGIILDLGARGDSQSHVDYAQRMYDWTLQSAPSHEPADWQELFDAQRQAGDYLHVFDYQGRRVTRQDLQWDDWHEWQAELNQKLRRTIAFLYGNFVQGVRRLVVDGVEPVGRPSDSIQLNLFEYVYHQVVRKEAQWVARDLFRQRYRELAETVTAHDYDSQTVGSLLLYTSQETMLNELIERPLDEGDALSNANTLIYMGKIREGNRVNRALYVAKHRGSECSDEIIPFEINDAGLQLAGS
ncbi:MAG TPA: recombinase RecA [Planctomycetes bacterium]|nr:recombinase RecA [Planctomycetaceae bacterium]HIN95316.1 recombinase RecA [Planctomycetota bacterium]